MKIGIKEFPDNCPNCNTQLIKKPLGITIKEGSFKVYSTYSVVCPKCPFETEKVKILREEPPTEYIEDVTPKKSFLKRIFNA